MVEHRRNVLMIGAGRLGMTLSQELVRQRLAGSLFLNTRSVAKLSSCALSLSVYALTVESTTQVFAGAPPDLGSIDLIVIAVKDDYDPRRLLKRAEFLPSGMNRDVRTIGFRRDLPLLGDVCRELKGYRGTIAVLTNPVELMAVAVKRWVPSAQVVGLGLSVDAARLAFVATNSGVPTRPVDCPLGGSHMGVSVPLCTRWTSAAQIRVQSSQQIQRWLTESRKIGPQVVRGLGFSLYDCAAVLAKDLGSLLQPTLGALSVYASLATMNDAWGGPIEQVNVNQLRTAPELVSEGELDSIENERTSIGFMVASTRKGSERR